MHPVCAIFAKDMESSVRIVRARTVDGALEEAFARLMPQLSSACPVPQRAALERIAASPCTALFFAEAGGRIAGVLTAAAYEVPSGRKVWIEDVVVDAAARGRGIGRSLVGAAVAWARSEGADRVMLTSNPARREARALYRSLGFGLCDTGVFRMDLTR